MKKYLHNFAFKSMKIAQNVYAFYVFPIFHHLNFLFPLRKISKNNNFEARTSKFQIKNICGQISKKLAELLGFENA